MKRDKAENMDVDDEDKDDDYFNPNIYFICKLCRQTFPSVKELLSHKRSQHTKNELKGIQSIIFEERFSETKFQDNIFSISVDSGANAVSSSDTAEFISDQNEEVKSCESNDSSCSESEKVTLSSPFVRVTRLTSKKINSLLNRRSCPIKTDASDENVMIQNKTNKTKKIEIPDCAVNVLEPDAANKNSSTPAIQIVDANQGSGDSSLRKRAVSIDLTEDEISELVQDDEVVDLSGPYVRLEKLTAKQIESKLKSRSTVNPDIPELSGEYSAGLHSSATTKLSKKIAKLPTESACSSLNNSNLSAPGRESEYESVQNKQNVGCPIQPLLESPTRSNSLTSTTASKTNNSEAQMCSGCGQVFHAVVEVEDHEKECRHLPRNQNKKLYLKNNSVVSLTDPLKLLRAKGDSVQKEKREDVQVVYEKVKKNSAQAKKILSPIDKSRSSAIRKNSRAKLPSLPRPTRLINRVGSTTKKLQSSTNKANHESSIEKWINCQNQIQYRDGTLNVILFSRDPTSSGSTSQISTKNPRICKLCSTKLVTGKEFQNHCKNCFLHNKDRHIYCISCNKNFENPQQLNFHLMNIHFTPENLPEPEKSGDSSYSKLPAKLQIEDKNKVENFENNPEEGDDLPLAEWLIKRKQNFPDFILLDPDPIQPKFPINWIKFGIRCRLCNGKLRSETATKMHVAVCWAYNKKFHSFCARCKIGGWDPELLLKHRLSAHSGKLLPLPPFFCVECKQEFQTQEELHIHEKSLRKFCDSMRMAQMAVYRKQIDSISSSTSTTTTTATATRTSSIRGSTVRASRDSDCLIYPATNIFEEPDAWTETQSKIRNPNIKTVSSSKESKTGTNTVGTTRGRNKSKVGGEEQNQTSLVAPQTFSCPKCKQSFNSAFTLKCHDDPQYTNCTIYTIQESASQQAKLPKEQSSHSCVPKVCTALERVKAKRTQKTSTEITLTEDHEDDDVQIIDAVESLPMQKEKDCKSHEEILEAQQEAGASTVSLADWLQFQSDRECSDPDGSVNVILLDPDPASTVHVKPIKISSERPVTCKLCQTKLETEPDVKNHAGNCWLHNKDRHIFCITCEIPFKHPMQLKEHYKCRHSDLDTITNTNNTGTEKSGDTEVVNENELDLDGDLDLDLLPLGEWIQKRKKMFPDLILVHPDPGSDSYLNAVKASKPGTRLSSSNRLMCDLCRFTCQSEKEMKWHVLSCWTYNKKNHVYCAPCGLCFTSPALLEGHERISHKKRTALCCRDCHQEFKSDSDLKEHEDSALEFFHKMKLVQVKMNSKRSMSESISAGVDADAGADISTNSNSNSNQKGKVGRGHPQNKCAQGVAKKDQSQNHTRHYYGPQQNKLQPKLKCKTFTRIIQNQNSKLPAKSRKSSCTICDKSFLSHNSLEKHILMCHAHVQGQTGANAKHNKKEQVGIPFQCSEPGCKRDYKHYHFAQQEDVELLKLANVEEGNIQDEGTEVQVRKSITKTPTGAIDNNEETMEHGERDGTATSSDQSVISNDAGQPPKIPKFDTGSGFAELRIRVTRAMLAQAKSKD